MAQLCGDPSFSIGYAQTPLISTLVSSGGVRHAEFLEPWKR
jgi:hypothetical protein